jgi:hypothetical protein
MVTDDQGDCCFSINIIGKYNKIREIWLIIRYCADAPARFFYVYFCGSESNFFLQPGAQKKYFLPLYSLVNFAVFSSTVILQIGSIAML